MPKSRIGFWKQKFDKNVNRDRRNQCELRKLGWNVIVLWECQATRCPEKVAGQLLKKLVLYSKALRALNDLHGKPESRNHALYSMPERKELLKIAEKRADYNQSEK